MKDIFHTVTKNIIAALEQGVVPWLRPWTTHLGLPLNYHTGKVYRGINILCLWTAAHAQEFVQDQWLTLKQANAAGGRVYQGEKGTSLFFWQPVSVSDDDEDITKKRTYPLARTFTVFNLQQVEGLESSEVTLPQWSSEVAAEKYLQLATIRYGFDGAYYAPLTDTIKLPPRSSFTDAAGFYSTALHELVHWTGAVQRLARIQHYPFGSSNFCREELVAEMGAAFLGALTGIPGNLRHAEYIGEWLRAMQGDSRVIFSAASQAQKAVDYLQACVVEAVRNQSA